MASLLDTIDSTSGFTNSGGLEKLTIYGFQDINRDEKETLKFNANASVFEAFINPDEFTVSYSTLYDHTMPLGTETTPAPFLASTPMELQLKFFIDGTLPRRLEDHYVTYKIQEFYNACGYTPERHRPKYIRIIWGSLTLMRFNPDIFDGCLKNVSFFYNPHMGKVW